MSIQLSRAEARRFLATYHFTLTDLPGVFTHLGTVQYDPLNPVGRNADLVLQARVPGYRVDDWQELAYTQRLIYDASDKQACLVPTSDWALRMHTREYHRPYHDREILNSDPGIVESIYEAIDARGPLCSQDFEKRPSLQDKNTWYGQTQVSRALRSMWACGMLLTHHRQNGHHYYDRPERVIPALHYNSLAHPTAEDYYRWIIARRYQAVGLLRATADACIWSACGNGTERRNALVQLVENKELIPVQIEGKSWQYYMPASALPYLDKPLPTDRVIFMGPLDSLIWDRKATQHIFDFDYQWEVYKPAAQRRWGYYVLPLFYRDRFIARLDSRLIGTTWHITHWWWEADITPDADLLEHLRNALHTFMAYMGAQTIAIADNDTHLLHAAAINIPAYLLEYIYRLLIHLQRMMR